MISIELVPTEVCHWRCNYCAFPSIDSPRSTTRDIIDRHYVYIKSVLDELKKNNFHFDLYIQGGEIGDLPRSIVKHLLYRINEKVTISTNGVFMVKRYHKDPEIRPYIKQIFWHVSPDCSNPNIRDITDDDIPIVRGIVHQSDDIMKEFIRNTELDIEYKEIEVPFGEKSPIPENIIYRCREYHKELTIDLVNEKLCLCIRNFKSITIPLNEYNLIKLLKQFPRDVFNLPDLEDSACYSCSRLCVSRKDSIVEQKLKLRDIFS